MTEESCPDWAVAAPADNSAAATKQPIVKPRRRFIARIMFDKPLGSINFLSGRAVRLGPGVSNHRPTETVDHTHSRAIATRFLLSPLSQGSSRGRAADQGKNRRSEPRCQRYLGTVSALAVAAGLDAWVFRAFLIASSMSPLLFRPMILSTIFPSRPMKKLSGRAGTPP